MKITRVLPYRFLFYFRQGYAQYFTFFIGLFNTLTLAYFIALQEYPSIRSIFPSFELFVIAMSVVGIPSLITIGWWHMKRSHAFSQESKIIAESNPYFFKVPDGHSKEVTFPLYLMMINFLIDNAKTGDEIKKLVEIKKKIDVLLDGGMVGKSISH